MSIEIGSSDAPVILGVSPHLTPWALWAQKVGLIPRVDEPDEMMRAGTRHEPVVVEWAVEAYNLDARGAVVLGGEGRITTEYHPERKWQRSTPDAVAYVHDVPWSLVEAKCVRGSAPSSPRVEWVVQCLHHLLVYEEAERVILAAFGGLRYESWVIPRHQQALDRVLRAEEHFLGLVEREEPPPVRPGDAMSLWRAWPMTRDEVVTLPADALEWDAALVKAEREEATAHAAYETARNKIRAAMGAVTRAVLPDGSARYTWRQYQRGETTVRPLKRTSANGKDGE